MLKKYVSEEEAFGTPAKPDTALPTIGGKKYVTEEEAFAPPGPAEYVPEHVAFGDQDSAATKGFKRLGQGIDYAKEMTVQNYPEAAEAIGQAVEYQQRNPGSPERIRIGEQWRKDDETLGEGVEGTWQGIKNVAGGIVDDVAAQPTIGGKLRATGANLQALGGAVVEQVPNMLPPVAGMVIGGAAGSLTPAPGVGTAVGAFGGATSGNTLVEGQGIALKSLEDAGINPTDREAVAKHLEENAGTLFGQALTKGAIIGLVDTITAGTAGKLLTGPARAASERALTSMGVNMADKAAVKLAMDTPEFAAKIAGDTVYQASKAGAGNIARNVTAAGLDPLGEGVGEFVGEGMATGDWSVKEAAVEAISSVGQSGFMYAGQKAYQAATKPSEREGKATPPEDMQLSEEERRAGMEAIRAANPTDADIAALKVTPDLQRQFGITAADLEIFEQERAAKAQVEVDFAGAPEAMKEGARAAIQEGFDRQLFPGTSKELTTVNQEDAEAAQFGRDALRQNQERNQGTQQRNQQRNQMTAEEAAYQEYNPEVPREDNPLLDQWADDAVGLQQREDQKRMQRQPLALPPVDRDQAAYQDAPAQGFEMVSPEESARRVAAENEAAKQRGQSKVDSFFTGLLQNIEQARREGREPQDPAERKLLGMDPLTFKAFEEAAAPSKDAARQLASRKLAAIEQANYAGYITDEQAAEFEQEVIAQRKAWVQPKEGSNGRSETRDIGTNDRDVQQGGGQDGRVQAGDGRDTGSAEAGGRRGVGIRAENDRAPQYPNTGVGVDNNTLSRENVRAAVQDHGDTLDGRVEAVSPANLDEPEKAPAFPKRKDFQLPGRAPENQLQKEGGENEPQKGKDDEKTGVHATDRSASPLGDAPLSTESFTTPKGKKLIAITGETYAHKDTIKAIPGARWNKTRRAWTVPEENRADMEKALAGLVQSADAPGAQKDIPEPQFRNGNVQGEGQSGTDIANGASTAEQPGVATVTAPVPAEASPTAEKKAAKYFKSTPTSRTMKVADLVAREPIPDTPARQEKLARAKQRMDASLEAGEPRAPISVVKRPDGTFKVLDGNTTFHVLQERGEADVEVEVVKPSQPAKKIRSADDLIAAAKAAQPEYNALIDKMAEESGAAQIASRKGDGLKSMDSIERKVKDEYDGNHYRLVDVLGKTLLFDDEQSLRAGLASVLNNPQVMGWKDRWEDPLPSGYQDINISVRMANGHVAELQMMTRDMFRAKEEYLHSVYEVMRKLKPETGVDQDVKESVTKELIALSDAGYARASQDGRKLASHKTHQDAESSRAFFRSILEDSLRIFQMLARADISRRFSPAMRKTLDEALSKTYTALSPSRNSGSLMSESTASGGPLSGIDSSLEGAGGVDPTSTEIIPTEEGEVKKPGGEMTVTRASSSQDAAPEPPPKREPVFSGKYEQFYPNDKVVITAGEHAGKTGSVSRYLQIGSNEPKVSITPDAGGKDIETVSSNIRLADVPGAQAVTAPVQAEASPAEDSRQTLAENPQNLGGKTTEEQIADVTDDELDDIFAEAAAEFSAEKAVYKKPRSSQPAKPKKSTPPKKGGEKKVKSPQKAPREIVTEGGIAARSAIKNLAAGFNALFGDPNTLRSGLVFDEETYKKAKPLLQAAWLDIKDVGYSIKDLVKFYMDQYGEKIAPYLKRFIQDLRDGKIETQPPNEKLTDAPQGDTIEGQGGGADANRQEQGDVPGAVRKDGEAAETDSDRALGGLEAEGSQAADQGGTPPRGGAESGGEGVSGDRGAKKGRVSKPRGGGGGNAKVHNPQAGEGGAGRTGENSQPRVDPGNIPAANFVITDDVGLGQGGETVKYNDNIAAIKTLKTLQREMRRATAEEQRTLARYVGWGGLANAFRNVETKEVKEGWEQRVAELESLLSPEELAVARNSTQNAHYTSKAVIDGVWSALRHLGFKGGNTLEPAVGTGNFIGLVPPEIAGATNFVGVEYENITAGIAANLYPQSTILHSGFERVPIPDGSFDLVIGNPPFGQKKLTFPGNPHLSRHTIHNQFFLAGIDALRPGGIQAMVVSRYLLDSKDSTVRELLAKEANLLGVVRLPETAFKENARTEVITDIIFLQKKTELERNPPKRFDDKGKEIPPPPYVAPSWVHTTDIPDPLGGEPMTVNRYFADNPDAILGKMDRSGSMRFGADITVKLPAGADMASMLVNRLRNILPKGIAAPPRPADKAREAHDALVQNLEIVMNGFEDGNVLLSSTGTLQQIIEQENANGDYILTKRDLTPESAWSNSLVLNSDGKWFREVDKLDAKGNKIKDGNRNVKTRQVFENEKDLPGNMKLGEDGYRALKHAVVLLSDLYEQIRLETTNAPEAQIEAHRKKLRKGYNGFVADHGHLHAKKASRVIAGMPNSALLYSLESKYKAPLTKERAAALGIKPRPAIVQTAAILNERVTFPYQAPERAENPADALAIVLSESGAVDLDRLAELLDTDIAGATKALHDDLDAPLIFFDPETKRWETADEYLGGNVARKLEAAKQQNLGKNVRALEKIQPEAWGADKITPIFGAAWIPAEDYGAFISHITGSTARVRFNAHTNSFSVVGDARSVKAQQWNTPRRDIIEIAEAMINSKPIKIYQTQHDGSRIFLQEETELAIAKGEELKLEFDQWIFQDSDRRHRLVELFNQKFNVRVLKQRDGSHLKLPGAVPFITMRRHQKNGIWRGIVDRTVLYDHAVGSGKTYTSIARVMERRRMGLSKKPMVVVPNHIVEQFAAAVYRLYPGAKVLTAGKADMSASKRRRVFAKIATGDWDVVIVPHSSFGFIGIDAESEKRFLDEQLQLAMEAVEEAWDEAELDGYDRDKPRRKPHTVKEAERVLDNIKGKLDALKDRNDSRDRLLTFEQLGVDDLTVDEAHEFKNLFYNSSLSVRGMNPKQGSNKAYDLWTKVRVLRESPTGSVAFLTGTPISNSAVEMYGLMRYLIPDMLADAGLEHFDAWRNSFTTVSSAFEYTEAGTGLKEVSRLGRDWANMRMLMDMYYSFSDSVSNDDIARWYAEDNDGARYPLPNVKNGGRTPVVTKPTPAQRQILDDIITGFNNLPNERDPKIRNAERLRLMDRARKLSLDARAVDPFSTSTEAGGKLEAVTENAMRIYKEWTKDKGTQLIFLDRSIAKEKGHAKLLAEYDALLKKYTEADQKGDEEEARKIVEKLERFDANTMAEIRTAQAGGWNAYQQTRDNLIAQGVPAHEIRFVGDADTDAKKKELFEEVNAGTVRFLIGSTAKMGAGTNVQHRLVGLHHVDVGWKPSDIEQREGRIIRQGNELYKKYGEKFEVEILAYVTENTIDAKMWSLNSTKLKMINGIRQYKGEFNMEFEDEDAVGMAEIAAIASGEPLQLEQVKLTTEIDRLERLKKAHRKQTFSAKDELDNRKRQVEIIPKQLEVWERHEKAIKTAYIAAMKETEGWSININGRDYDRVALRAGVIEDLFKTIKAEAVAAAEAKAEVVIEADGKETKKKRPPANFAVEINGEKVRTMDKAFAKVYEALGDGVLVLGELDGTKYREKDKLARAIEAKVDAHTLEGNTEGELGTVTLNGTEIELSYQQIEETNSEGKKGYETTIFFELDDKAKDGSRVVVAYGRDQTLSPSPHKMTPDWSLTAKIADVAHSLKTLDDTIARHKARDAQNKEAIPELEKAANRPFAREQELADKKSRLKEVEDQLSSRAPRPATAQSSREHLLVSSEGGTPPSKEDVLAAVEQAKKAAPQGQPKPGVGISDVPDDKVITVRGRKMVRLPGQYALVKDPEPEVLGTPLKTRLGWQIYQRFEQGQDPQPEGEKITGLAAAKRYAEHYLRGQTEPTGNPHTFRNPDKSYSVEVPNSLYHLDNFARTVAKSSGVLFKAPAPAGATTVPAMEVIGERTDARAKRDIAALTQAVNEGRTKDLSFTTVDVSTEATKRARSIASLFNKRVVFFRGNNPAEDPGGVTVRTAGNVLFVNVASGYSDMAIIGHELLHHLKAQHPDIYERLKDSILALAKDSAVGDYQARLQRIYDTTGTGKTVDTALAEEELIADFIGDRFTEASFWNDLAGTEPSLFRRVAKAIKAFLDDLLTKFRGIAGFKTDPLFADLQAARKAAVTAIAEYSRRETGTIAEAAGVRKIEGGGVTYELPNSEIQREGGAPNSPVANRTGEPGIQDEPEVYYATGAKKEKRTAFQSKIGTIKTDVERVYSPASAARILAPIGKKAQETLQALILDKKGKPLAVLQHSVGGPTSNQVFPSQLLGSIINTKGADSFYIAHNHPSGNLIPSAQDADLTKALDNLIGGTGVNLAGHLVISPTGEATVLDNQGNVTGYLDTPWKTGSKTKNVRIVERQLKGDVPNVTQQHGVGNSSDAKSLLDGLNPGVLLLDAQHRPMEFVGVTIHEMGNLRDTGVSRAVLSKLDALNNASAAIIKINNSQRDRFPVENLITFLRAAGVRTLDVVDSNAAAMSDTGDVPDGRADKIFYSPTAGKAAAAGIPPNLSDLSPAMQAVAAEIKARMEAKRVSARAAQPRKAVGTTKGQEILAKSMTGAGNVSKAKVTKRFQGYEEMVAKLLNEKIDVQEKVRLVADYVAKFPREVRGTYGMESFPARITAASSDKRRLIIVRDALAKIDAAHEVYTKKTLLKEILALLKKNAPQIKGNIARQTSGGYDLYRELRAIKRTLTMTDKEVGERLNDIERKAAVEDLSFPEVLELRRLATYGRLLQASSTEAYQALQSLKSTIAGGKGAWQAEMDALRKRRSETKNEMVRVISGSRELKTETERLKDLQGMAKTYQWFKDSLRSFDDKHQSFEWLLDKLSRFDKGTGVLQSPLAKMFSPLVQRATVDEQTGTAAHMALLQEKMQEIFGLEGRALERRLNKNSAIVDKTGVYRRDGGLRKEEIPLSQNMAYKRWMEWQDPTLREQLAKQGYTEATMVEIENFMEDDVMEWAQWQLQEFYPQYYGGVNEVFKKIFYTDMPYNPKYSPIKRTYAKGQEDQNLLMQESHYSSVISGSVRNRVDNNRDIELQDGDTALAVHLAQMEHFKAWAEPMRELRGTLGGERVRQAIKDFHGPAALKVLNGFLDDFSRGKSAELVDTPMLQKFRGNFITAVLGVNPVVFLKQLTGIPAFAAEIPAGQWVKNLPKTPGEWINAWKEMAKSEVLRARYGEGFERDLIAAMSAKVPGKMAGTRKMAAKLMFFVRFGDKATATIGGWPVYKYHLAKGLKEGKSEDQARAEAMEKFEVAVERTQGSGNIKDMSAYQRGGEVARLFTMFMTTPTTFYRQMSGATRELQKSIALSREATKPGIEPTKAEEMRREAAKMRMDAARRLAVMGIILPIVFQFVAGAGFDDDDTLREIALGPMNGLFMLRDVATGVYDYSSGRPVFDSPGTPPPLSTLGELHTAVSKIMKKWRSDEWLVDEDFWKIVKSAGTVAGNVTGLPIGPVARLGEGVYDAATGDTVNPALRALGYSEFRLDKANRAYLDLRQTGLARKESDPAFYRAVTAHDERRAAMRKQLKTLQEKGADSATLSAERMRIRQSNQAFVDRWQSRA
jgi:N12 class adenine-specific DNA methylase